jgi:NADH-quinone oxidoreductase subunit J
MVVSALMVVLATSPIESVLFLVLTFFNAGIILFLYNLEFFGLTFIIIYVGAIAVLFLFVIMMLNIKLYSRLIDSLTYKNFFIYFVGFSITYIILINLYLNINQSFPAILNTFSNSSLITKNSYHFDDLSNINTFGQILYNNYIFYLPLAGLVLLIALVGVIVLTLHFNKIKKNQLEFRQLSRNDKFITFFKNKNN